MLRGILAAALIACLARQAMASEPDTSATPTSRRPRPVAMAPT